MYGPISQAYNDKQKQMNPDMCTTHQEVAAKIRNRRPSYQGYKTFLARGNRSITVYCENGIWWMKCSTFVTGNDHRVDEYLVCENKKAGIFRLTSRIAHGTVSIMMLAGRHQRWPVGGLVKMKGMK